MQIKTAVRSHYRISKIKRLAILPVGKDVKHSNSHIPLVLVIYIKNMYKNSHNSNIFNNQTLETTEMSLYNRWVNRLIHSHNGTLYSSENEQPFLKT